MLALNGFDKNAFSLFVIIVVSCVIDFIYIALTWKEYADHYNKLSYGQEDVQADV